MAKRQERDQVRVTSYVPAKVYERLRKQAFEERRSISDLVRELIQHYLKP